MKLVLFDADGVLLDSMHEVVITSWNAYRSYIGESDERVWSIERIPDYYVKGMLEYQARMGDVAEVLALTRILYEQAPIPERLEKPPREKVDEYRLQYLFKIREEFIKTPEFLKAMRAFPKAFSTFKELNARDDVEVFIVTARDAATVRAVLASQNVVFDPARVRDGTVGTKEEIIANICEETGITPSDAYFFDDHLGYLLPTLTDSRLQGLHTFLCYWGRNDERMREKAKQHGIRVIQQEEFLSCVDE